MLYQHREFRLFHCFENYKSSVSKTTVICELNVRLSWNFDTYRLKLVLPENLMNLLIVVPSVCPPTNLLSDVLNFPFGNIHSLETFLDFLFQNFQWGYYVLCEIVIYKTSESLEAKSESVFSFIEGFYINS